MSINSAGSKISDGYSCRKLGICKHLGVLNGKSIHTARKSGRGDRTRSRGLTIKANCLVGSIRTDNGELGVHIGRTAALDCGVVGNPTVSGSIGCGVAGVTGLLVRRKNDAAKVSRTSGSYRRSHVVGILCATLTLALYEGVTLRSDLYAVAIATSTGVNSRACLGAGGIGGYRLIGVTGSCNLVGNGNVTASAGVGSVTCLSAGRSSYNRLIRVTGSCNLISSVAVATSTGVGGIASLGASRSSYRRFVSVTKSLNSLGLGSNGLTGTCGTGSGLNTSLGASSGSGNFPLAEVMSVYIAVLEVIAISLATTAGLVVVGLLATVSRDEILLLCDSLVECMKVIVINDNTNGRSYNALHGRKLYAAFLRSVSEDRVTISINEVLDLIVGNGNSKSSLGEGNVVAANCLVKHVNCVSPIKGSVSYSIPCDVSKVNVAYTLTGNETTEGECCVLGVSTLNDSEGELNLSIILVSKELLVGKNVGEVVLKEYSEAGRMSSKRLLVNITGILSVGEYISICYDAAVKNKIKL